MWIGVNALEFTSSVKGTLLVIVRGEESALDLLYELLSCIALVQGFFYRFKKTYVMKD